MGSTLKIAIPIALVFGVVFAVTVINKLDNTPVVSGGVPTAALPEFAYTDVRYNPASDNVWDQHFPGFFEVNDDEHAVSFWFKNRNPEPIAVRVLARSCSSCTSARIAVVPPDGPDAVAAWAAAGLFPASPLPVPDLLTPMAVAALDRRLQWHEYTFPSALERPTEFFVVPGAADDAHPVWAVFQLAVTVKSVGPVTRSAALGISTEDVPGESNMTLSVHLAGINPFEVTPGLKDVGTLAEGAGPQAYDVVYFSATRPLSELPPPSVLVEGNAPFLTVGDPVPMTDPERRAFVRTMVEEKSAVPVKAAYRIPMTVTRTGAGGREPDIGPFEAAVSVTGPGASGSRRAVVKGVMAGVVSLDSGDVLKLGKNGIWDVKYGTSTTTRLVSERPGLELEVVPGATTPGFLDVSLGPVEVKSGRRSWPMTIVVPPSAGAGPLGRDAAVVLRTKGPDPITIRIPVEGNGYRRD